MSAAGYRGRLTTGRNTVKKLILLAVLAGLAWWYFDGSRRMTEAHIRAAYEADMDAMRRFDADAMCARLADDFSVDQTARQGDETVELHFDKPGLCRHFRQSVEAMQRLSTATGGRFALDIRQEVKDIALSADRKHATVQTVSTVRLGDMTLARDRTTEHLIRRNGRILSTGGESRVWAYDPQ
jgi:ketosteroid isomerase-like protein